MKTLAGLIVLSAMLWSANPAPAHADTAGYVCFSAYSPVNGTAGQFGFIRVEFRSQPWCGGSIVANRSYCSLGATAPECASSAYVHQTAASVLAMAEQLQSAGQTGFRVYEFSIGTPAKGFYVGYYSN